MTAFLEIDNTTAERSARPLAVGRKNYLFMGSEAGGKSAATAYTLIETGKMSNFNPEIRLKWMLEQTQDHRGNRIHDLLTWAYQDMINAAAPEEKAKTSFQ
ncbi:transposase [Rhodobacteraceae bacterium Araon29]